MIIIIIALVLLSTSSWVNLWLYTKERQEVARLNAALLRAERPTVAAIAEPVVRARTEQEEESVKKAKSAQRELWRA